MSFSTFDLEKDVHRAQNILSFFTDPGKGQDIKKLIPPSVLARAHGIVFIRLYRVGFLVSAKGGTGIIIARLPDGSWSAPSGVSLTSVGFGHQAGGEIIDSIIVMNYRGAVKAFFDAGGQLQLGIAVSIAAGPLGRSADVSASASSMSHVAATYAYSSSKGLFVGYSFEGSKISERIKTNASFYGRQISAREILTGAVAPPQMAAGLYNILYAIGAAGPQPGVTFGPVKSLSMGHSPKQQQQQQHPATASPINNGSFYSSKDPYSYSPTAASPNTAYAPATTPNGYPIEKSQQQYQQQQHSYRNSQPYHRGSLQPSLSIRNPPQLNPGHSTGDVIPYQPPHTRTPDAAVSSTEFAEPPPPYEPSQSSSISHASSPSSSPVTPTNGSKQNTMSLPTSSPIQQPQTQHNQHRPLIDASSSPSPAAATAFVASPVSSIQNQGFPTTAATAATPPFTTKTATGPSSPVTSTQPSASSGASSFVVVAKYDFGGQEQGDLPFKTGDHITVTQWTDDRESWWQGTLGTKSGCFPANYTNNL